VLRKGNGIGCSKLSRTAQLPRERHAINRIRSGFPSEKILSGPGIWPSENAPPRQLFRTAGALEWGMDSSPLPSAEPKRREKQRTHAGRHCKIVTFYEDFADAARAMKKFDSIVRAFGGDLPVHATSWSFELLCKARLNSIILDDVSHADVLIVASNGNRPLPERVASWVEICVHAAPGGKPVIVGLHDEELEPDGVAAPLCSSLDHAAKRTGAAFMCNRDLAERLKPDAASSPIRARRENPDSAVAAAQYPAAEDFRWWGIND